MLAKITEQFEPRLVGTDVTWVPVSPPEGTDRFKLTYFCWSCGAEAEILLGGTRPSCCGEQMSAIPLVAFAY